jgi:hypothetical protein
MILYNLNDEVQICYHSVAASLEARRLRHTGNAKIASRPKMQKQSHRERPADSLEITKRSQIIEENQGVFKIEVMKTGGL